MHAGDSAFRISIVQQVTLGSDATLPDQLSQTVNDRGAQQARAAALYEPTVVTRAETDIYRTDREVRSRVHVLGIALQCTWHIAPGTKLAAMLPGNGESLSARVASHSNGGMAWSRRRFCKARRHWPW
jgi:hypothetical protein